MIEKVKIALDLAFKVFDMVTMKGVYALPFVFVTLWFITTNTKKNEKIVKNVLFLCILGALFLLSPLFGILSTNQLDTRMVRFWWTLPFSLLIIYGVIEVVFSCPKRLDKIVSLCVFGFGLIACGRQQNETFPKIEQKWPWIKADNIYKVPSDVYQICDVIGEQQCVAAFPREIAQYVRIYAPNISMPYNGLEEEFWNDSYKAVCADKIDENDVGEMGVKWNLDYIVLDESKIIGGDMERYGYSRITEVNNSGIDYVIFGLKK